MTISKDAHAIPDLIVNEGPVHPHPSIGGEGGGGVRVVADEAEPHPIVPIKGDLDSPHRCLCPHSQQVLIADTHPLPLHVQAHGEAVVVDAVHGLRDDGLAADVPVETCSPCG